MLVIDTSAIVKFFSKEPGWEDVKTYIAEALSINLALIELSSALSKKIAKDEIKEDVALECIKDYSGHVFLLDERKYLEFALKLSIRKGIPIYDCLFIAAALQENCDLVSCDDKQIKIANSIGVKTIRC